MNMDEKAFVKLIFLLLRNTLNDVYVLLIIMVKKYYFFPVRCDFWLSSYFMSWWEGRLVQQTEIAISQLLFNELR